ncbi:MAG: hypothetical protein K1X67_02530 [Fimbriimonadaceae bacterium]|nr:hypothetical protein [Fimbriimonadaceae bacterium]
MNGAVATNPAGFRAELAGITYGLRTSNDATSTSVALNDVLAAVAINVVGPETGLWASDSNTGTLAVLVDTQGAVFGNGIGVPGVAAASDIDHSVSATHAGFDPTLAALYGQGSGVNGPGVPRAAALRLDDGAVLVGGPLPNRFAGSTLVPGPWLPIFSCLGGDPPHGHVIGYYCDVPVANALVIPGPPNFGTIIQVSVETAVPPMGNTSYNVQAHSKVPGGFVIRVTRMGDPGACAPPVEPTFAHYTLINPVP